MTLSHLTLISVYHPSVSSVSCRALPLCDVCRCVHASLKTAYKFFVSKITVILKVFSIYLPKWSLDSQQKTPLCKFESEAWLQAVKSKNICPSPHPTMCKYNLRFLPIFRCVSCVSFSGRKMHFSHFSFREHVFAFQDIVLITWNFGD